MNTAARRALIVSLVLAACGLGSGMAADKPARKKANENKAADAAKAKKPVVAVDAKSVKKLDAAGLSQLIDAKIAERLKEDNSNAAANADDAEFLRRVYLDIIGMIPTAEEAKAFLDSTEADKRQKLVDKLLADPKFGRHMADTWQALLLPRNSDNRRLQSEPMIKWLEKNFNDNTPWDKLARDLVTSSGSQEENGAVTFFVANPTADKMTDTIAKLLLGVQLQCAQCHNHPFTGWKQDEYWGVAAFFTSVRMQGNPKNAAKNGTTITVNEVNGPRNARANKLQKLPESAKIVPPKYLGGDQPKIESSRPLRPVFADWMTSPDNHYFAKAMVNRTWAQFFGKGFVNPIDDMHDGNDATHPELLAHLSAQFTASGYDLKNLIRSICNSQTYQRSSRVAQNTNTDLFGQMAVKVMSAEQLYDSLQLVLGSAATKGAPNRREAAAGGKRGPGGPREQFIAFFDTDDGADPTEYAAGIPQALRLMNANDVNRGADGLANSTKGANTEQVVEKIYLATLSRKPTSEEVQRLNSFVAKSGDSKKAYSDILWAILNSSEFTLNH